MTFRNSDMYAMHEIAQILNSDANQILLERFGVGFSQFKILLCLEERSGISQKYLAKKLNQTEASISRQILILEKNNLITVNISEKDVRKNLVYPTNLGIEIITKGTRTLENLSSRVFSGLSKKQTKYFSESLGLLRGYLAG